MLMSSATNLSRARFDGGVELLPPRYYEPTIGRFTSLDTYEGHTNDPQSLHRYAYVKANPVNLVDPSGHEGLSELLTVTGIGTTLVATLGTGYVFHRTGGSALEGAWLGGTASIAYFIAKAEGRGEEALFLGFVQAASFALADLIAQGIPRVGQDPNDWDWNKLDPRLYNYNYGATTQAALRGFAAGVFSTLTQDEVGSAALAAANTGIGSFLNEININGWTSRDTWTSGTTYIKPLLDAILSAMLTFTLNEGTHRQLSWGIAAKILGEGSHQALAILATLLNSFTSGAVDSIFRTFSGRAD